MSPAAALTEPSACPQEDPLARFASGSLQDAERERIEAHLDECAACRVVVAAAAPPGAREEPALSLPRTLGRYRLDDLLGRGGMGVVYRATDTVLERPVAVKMLRVGGDVMARERLLREARAMARLSHPNVVTVYDFGQAEGDVYLVMELVEGQRLDVWLSAAPRTQAEVMLRFLEAGRGVAAAHAAGLVHRDFKPSNVLVGADQRARVTDFGLSRLQLPAQAIDAPVDTLTRAGALVGTPAYMAPEQLDGGAFGTRTDQFAFCVSLVESLGGARPWTAKTTRALRAAMNGPPKLPPGLSPPVEAALRRGLALTPDGRFPHMDELLFELVPARRRRARRALALSVAAVVLAGVGGGLLVAKPWEKAPAVVVERHTPAHPVVELLPGEGLLTLRMGQRRQVWVPGVERLAVGDDSVADAHVVGKNLLELTPASVGRTTLLAWSKGERRSFVLVVNAAETEGSPSPAP